MKTLAHYLQLALLAYFFLFLLFFIFFESLGSLFGMDPIASSSLVKVFLTGLLLFLATWISKTLHTKGLTEQIKKMEIEMNSVKAKLYDLEHPKIAQPSKPVPQKNQEESSGMIRPRQNFTDQ